VSFLHAHRVAVKVFNSDGVAPRRPAHFVQPDHAIETIEDGVLHALRHYRRRELLEPQQELALAGAALTQRQNVSDKVE